MSAHRRPTIRFTDAPRGTCRWCGETIIHPAGPRQGEVDRRRRWHPACVDEYNRSDPREARRRVRRRDRGVCRACRLDTRGLAREVRGRGRTARLRKLGFKPRGSLWELDHIVPLIDGGGHDLDNLQTLCVPCHEKKTAREARERAERRRAEAAEQPPAQPQTPPAEPRPPPLSEPFGAPPNEPGHTGAARELDALLSSAEAANRRVEAVLARLGRPDCPGARPGARPALRRDGGGRLA